MSRVSRLAFFDSTDATSYCHPTHEQFDAGEEASHLVLAIDCPDYEAATAVSPMDDMSEPNSPTIPNERVYRFISDPGHKENLSGRVRAACMTCRRKKIKCSGELNCRTCREKGLVCEGLPERKRPRRDGGSISLDPGSSGGIERKRRISHVKKTSLKRPSLSSLKQSNSNSESSEDSGYASPQPENGTGILSPIASIPVDTNSESRSLPDKKVDNVRSSNGLSQSGGLIIDTWRLNSEPTGQRDPSSFDTLPLTLPSEVSPNAQPQSAALEPSPVDWSRVADIDSWWNDTTNEDAPNLLSTARALEEQAQSLRLMATRQQHNSGLNDSMSRRQTIAFPLPSPGGFETRYDILQNQHGIFDDMALLLANRTPGSGMTPGLNEFSSWWDLNAGDLSSLLSPGQTIQPSTMDQQRMNPYDETPTSRAAPDMPTSQQQTSQDGYFGQFWPE